MARSRNPQHANSTPQPGSLRVVSTLRLPTGYRHDLFTPRPHCLPQPRLRTFDTDTLTRPLDSSPSCDRATTDGETHHAYPLGQTFSSQALLSAYSRFLACLRFVLTHTVRTPHALPRQTGTHGVPAVPCAIPARPIVRQTQPTKLALVPVSAYISVYHLPSFGLFHDTKKSPFLSIKNTPLPSPFIDPKTLGPFLQSCSSTVLNY